MATILSRRAALLLGLAALGSPLAAQDARTLALVQINQQALFARARRLAGLDDEIALCGLAKRLEEVWLPDEEWPVILPRTSEGLYLLQRLRDEAHRFAITFHRSKRSKAMVESVLDDVPGLGEVRRKALLKKFSSVRALRRASAEEIAELPGFGPKLATQVVTALQGEQTPTGVNTATGEVIEE